MLLLSTRAKKKHKNRKTHVQWAQSQINCDNNNKPQCIANTHTPVEAVVVVVIVVIVVVVAVVIVVAVVVLSGAG